MNNNTTTPLILLFICFVVVVSGWGPFTHQTFSCTLLNNCSLSETPLSNLLTNNKYHYNNKRYNNNNYNNITIKSNSFTLGSSSPDVFKTLSPPMHDLVYAGHQFLYALQKYVFTH